MKIIDNERLEEDAIKMQKDFNSMGTLFGNFREELIKKQEKED